ncbi:MAG: LCP family protein [Oscillochloris sp.]|nr:LCP family protein [Oscillochloris sp.]
MHLARCVDCRSVRMQQDADLLRDLLTKPAINPAILRPAVPVMRRSGTHIRPARSSWLRIAGTAVLGIVLLFMLINLGRVAFAAYTISQSVAAMQLQPTPALARPGLPNSAGPTALVPTAVIVRPSAVATEAPLDLAPIQITPLDPLIAEPPTVPPVATPTAGFRPSPTAVRLPAVGMPVPTLMATAPVQPIGDEAVNILLLGSDRRPGESWATRSDSIMVLRLEPRRQRVAMLSLPRDLIVPIPGYGQARINAATVYGDLDPGLGGGVELARRTVSEYLDIPIQHVLRVDFSAFIAAVDAIGGVDIFVEEALYDSAYPTMDYGYREVYFAPGMQRMDGATALVYARVRHMDSNYARNRRQQQILLAMIDQVRQRDPVSQVELLSDVSVALRDHVQTDMSLEQMLGFAWAFRTILPQHVERYAVDETMVSEGVLADDPYATFANPGAISALMSRFLRGDMTP